MKESQIVLLLALFIGMGPGATSAATTPATQELTCTVVNPDDQPVPGAVADIFQFWSGTLMRQQESKVDTLTSDANGVFKVKASQTHSIGVIRKDGLAPAWFNLYSQMGSDQLEQRVMLTPPTNFVGLVVDQQDAPVPNADVWIAYAMVETRRAGDARSYSWLSGKLAKDLFSTRADADGRFRLGGFPSNGAALLLAKAPGKVIERTDIQNLGPDTLTRPGTDELKLVLAPAGRVEGGLRTESGEPVPNATVWLQPQGGGFAPPPEPVETGKDGAFAFSEVGAGGYLVRAQIGTNTPPEWVTQGVQASVAANEVTRDIKLVATQGGLLEITVLGEDGKPTAGAYVNAHREGHHEAAPTGDSGKAVLRLPPGQYNVSANKERSMAENTMAEVEVGKTKQLELQFQPRPKIAGKVLDPSGKPLANVELSLFPNWGGISDGPVRTDEDGKFEMNWDPRQFGGMDRNLALIARDTGKNLAAAQDIDEETRALDLKLEPGLTITGRVETMDGKPLKDASISLTLWAANMGSSFGEQPVTDAEGRFKVSGLPANRRYTVNARATGYGSQNQSVNESGDENHQVALEAFVLNVADRDFAGQVVNEEEKPVSGANVSIQGDGQPYVNMVTDKDGRFSAKVCEGVVRLWAHAQNSYANLTAEGGDTNVVLQLRSYSSAERMAPKRVSLKGRPLPDLAPLGFSSGAAAPGPVLLCLFDSEQRPSRRFIKSVGDKCEQLGKNKVTVLGLQATVIEAEALQEWRVGNPLPFPIGRLAEPTAAVKWVTDVETLPWLILTDAEHKIVEEGFDLDEIEAKVEALGK